jgi:hypothetical protein
MIPRPNKLTFLTSTIATMRAFTVAAGKPNTYPDPDTQPRQFLSPDRTRDSDSFSITSTASGCKLRLWRRSSMTNSAATPGSLKHKLATLPRRSFPLQVEPLVGVCLRPSARAPRSSVRLPYLATMLLARSYLPTQSAKATPSFALDDEADGADTDIGSATSDGSLSANKPFL